MEDNDIDMWDLKLWREWQLMNLTGYFDGEYPAEWPIPNEPDDKSVLQNEALYFDRVLP